MKLYSNLHFFFVINCFKGLHFASIQAKIKEREKRNDIISGFHISIHILINDIILNIDIIVIYSIHILDKYPM